MRFFPGHYLCLLLAPLLCGCGGNFTHDSLLDGIEDGLSKIAEARQFDVLFGKENVDHFVSYSGPDTGSDWHSRVFFGGRYELTLQCEVKMSRNYDRVVQVLGPPSFYFSEYGSIERTGGGMTQLMGRMVHHPEIPYPFDTTLWQRFLDSRGDITVLSERLDANQAPLDLFDEFVLSWRRDMLKRRN